MCVAKAGETQLEKKVEACDEKHRSDAFTCGRSGAQSVYQTFWDLLGDWLPS